MSHALVCLIACHAGPADHFATYAEALRAQGHEVHIHATGPALAKFQERNIQITTSFSLDNLQSDQLENLAKALAEKCQASSYVLTDVGHTFSCTVQKALSSYTTCHLAYYDNPEPFVPGGYSSIAANVMQAAKGILFANAHLASQTMYSAPGQEVDFGDKKRIAIGYYPVNLAQKIAKRREQEQASIRSDFLTKHDLEDRGQKIYVYFGGNNDDYFSKAFPAFLSILEEADLNNVVIALQQHPGAKAKNVDGKLIESSKIILSNLSTEEAQVMADVAFYYQTSMGPQFILEGLACIQIGHEPYEDILVRNRLAPSVTNAAQFIASLENLGNRPQADSITASLGINKEWYVELEKVLLHK